MWTWRWRRSRWLAPPAPRTPGFRPVHRGQGMLQSTALSLPAAPGAAHSSTQKLQIKNQRSKAVLKRNYRSLQGAQGRVASSEERDILDFPLQFICVEDWLILIPMTCVYGNIMHGFEIFVPKVSRHIPPTCCQSKFSSCVTAFIWNVG